MKKWLIFIILTTSILFAENELYSRLDLPFADKPQLKSEELKLHKNSYIEAASKLRAISDSRSKMGPLGAATMYDKKLNLNSLEEFYKIGVDVIEVCNHIMLDSPNTLYKENALLSDVVLIGRAVSQEYSNGDYLPCLTKFEIMEVLSDKGYLSGNIKEISIATQSAPNSKGSITIRSHEPYLIIGEEVIIFATVFNYYYGNDRFSAKKPYIFYPDMVIHDFKNGKNESYGETEDDYQTIIKTVKKIAEINDAKNFYNRSYK